MQIALPENKTNLVKRSNMTHGNDAKSIRKTEHKLLGLLKWQGWLVFEMDHNGLCFVVAEGRGQMDRRRVAGVLLALAACVAYATAGK